jgi:excinuclease ABC subunit C
MITDKLNEKLSKLPTVPGVYKYYDIEGKVIYVGKAKNLRNRVKSYFRIKFDDDTKTKALVENIYDLEYIEVSTELEALILEEKLVKKFQPRYNILLKDDKSFLYIVLRNDAVKVGDSLINFPIVFSARKTDLQSKDIYFGPYPRAEVAKYVLRTLRKIIPFRDCTKTKFRNYQKLGQPCLYGHIGLCQAPCNGKISKTEYLRDVSKVKRFLDGKFKKIIDDVVFEMKTASKNEEFEKAAKLRDIIKKFEYLTINTSKIDSFVENPLLIEDIISKSLDNLLKYFPNLKEYPERIECYDISNLSGKEATASMTVALNGRLTNREYRRFKIKFKDTPDDYSMMKEVLKRRFKRSLIDDSWKLPNLIVLDGGKGQLSAGQEVLKEMGVDVAMISLAKREEILIYMDGSDFVEVKLDRTDESLKLIQRLRDEAHRFAKKYHHQLRVKKLLEN